jgi:hypothetical protein
MTTNSITIEALQAHRTGRCAYTGSTIDPREKCWWVEGYGLFRQDLTEKDIREFIAEENAEGMACELEAALKELDRRNVNLPTPALSRYRSLNPRQDS